MHEFISRAIISTDPEIDRVLGSRKYEVLRILGKEDSAGDPNLPLLSDVATGKLDADKLDYLQRDSFHAGVAYGRFDLERILHTIRTTEGSKRHIAVAEKGIDAIENYRLARYLMHAQVYEHHARLAADRMFVCALESAMHDEGALDKDLFRVNTRGYDANSEFLSHYMSLDDDSIYHTLKLGSKSGKSWGLLHDIRRRRLWKRACQFRESDLNALTRKDLLRGGQKYLDKMAADVASRLTIESSDIVFHLSDINIGLYGSGDLLFVNRRGKPYDINESSPISAESKVRRYYVFSPAGPETRRKIAVAVARELEINVDDIAI